MRKKRNENIRNTLKEMDILLIGMIVFYNINEKSCPFIYNLRKLTHRIKRATWRGDSDGHRSELRLACTYKVCVPTVINKMSKWDKSWKDYNNLAKRINTNQTTTANVDVSTIPYY